MRKWVAGVVALSVTASGCSQEEPSPFVGEWRSLDSGAILRIQESGDCRYIGANGIGNMCDWESLDDRRSRITVHRGDTFVEVSATLLRGKLHAVWPQYVDVFEQ